MPLKLSDRDRQNRRERIAAARPPVRVRESKADREWGRKIAGLVFEYPPATPAETLFRHGHWAPRRARVRQVLASTGASTHAMNRFDECGGSCGVEWSDSRQKHRLRATYCRCRHCEPCARSRANRMAANLKNRLAERPAGRYRFITLTLKHRDEPLGRQLTRLYACFKKVRKTKLWQDSQHGGAFFCEVKWSSKSRRWHPHLHVVAEGGYIGQRELSSAWHHATGDSTIVDIRALDNAKDAAHYLVKYVTKGTSVEVWADANAAQEWVTATKGLRVAATFGNWRGFKLMGSEAGETDWVPLGSLDAIQQDARAGKPWAIAVLISLRPPGQAGDAQADPPPRPGHSPRPPD